MSLIRIKARALIGTAAIADGLDVLRQPGAHEEIAASALESLAKGLDRDIPVTARTAVRASALSQTAGGVLVASSIAPRLGALASLAATLPAALLGYRFWTVKDNEDLRQRLKAGFFFHLLLAGADLLILTTPKRRRTVTKKTGKAAKHA
ncbi:MAG: DoxX family membrane protein [Bifidobacteriaceae bacterium]|jgi:uncharacterized membrane protein YphA (DoxX/SURF4 family)|nr:DoxX family membrane protein [Bifidobacteriaceae bacterium]